MQSAMQTVSAQRLEAPEAARLYVLTAIALHDGYMIAQGKTGYLSQIESAENLPPNAVMRAAVMAILQAKNTKGETEKTRSKAESLGALITSDITARLPKPAAQNFTPTGDWHPPAGQAPVLPQWRYAKPLTLSAPAQFRPQGPPAKDSPAYAVMVDEVRFLGEDVSDARSAEASVSARFWKAPAGTPTPPGQWNRIAMQTGQDLDTEAKLARLLALNIALYDVGIAAWDSKYAFQFARPDAIIEDWTAMGDTPAHPEYVSGHSAFSGAAAAVLTAFDGEAPFCTVNPDAFNIRRCYANYNAAATEAGRSRIYGGIHFTPSNTDGLKLGRDVAKHVLKTLP